MNLEAFLDCIESGKYLSGLAINLSYSKIGEAGEKAIAEAITPGLSPFGLKIISTKNEAINRKLKANNECHVTTINALKSTLLGMEKSSLKNANPYVYIRLLDTLLPENTPTQVRDNFITIITNKFEGKKNLPGIKFFKDQNAMTQFWQSGNANNTMNDSIATGTIKLCIS